VEKGSRLRKCQFWVLEMRLYSSRRTAFGRKQANHTQRHSINYSFPLADYSCRLNERILPEMAQRMNLHSFDFPVGSSRATKSRHWHVSRQRLAERALWNQLIPLDCNLSLRDPPWWRWMEQPSLPLYSFFLHLLAPPPSLSCSIDIGGYSPQILCCYVEWISALASQIRAADNAQSHPAGGLTGTALPVRQLAAQQETGNGGQKVGKGRRGKREKQRGEGGIYGCWEKQQGNCARTFPD
jgi:hypothetical protein